MGYRLKVIREKAGIIQEELAELSGISRGTIVALENNQSVSTTTKTLSKLAKALGVSVSRIFFENSV